jgi:signal transduction histidine kinase
MPEYYQIPALVLTILLAPAFGYLYLRFRDARTLLWFLGFVFCTVRMVCIYHIGAWYFADGHHPWITALGQASAQVGATVFLASLSPLSFRLGKLNILYVIPYTLPLVLYSILLEGVFHGISPTGPVFWIFPALGCLTLASGLVWGFARGSMPRWLGVSLACTFGLIALWVCVTHGAAWPLDLVECANHFLTALLLLYVFRRFSPGVVLSSLGFTAFSLSIFEIIPAIGQNPVVDINLSRVIVLGKVVAALGLILLALEDQLAINLAGESRERRTRREMEAYTTLMLSRRRIEDFDRQGNEICRTVVEHSRFAQAALLLQYQGHYRLAGSAGLEPAIVTALDEMAMQIPVEGFLAPGSLPAAVPNSRTMKLDLAPWLRPGDDLKSLHYTSVLAVPMAGRVTTEGAILLSGHRTSSIDGTLTGFVRSRDALRSDDLLAIEMLAARLQAIRSQTLMLEKLIDSEKYAGLGQLAGNVTQQLNNPLTVILGYASLLEETNSLNPRERKGVESILSEARRMRATLDSLTRISRPQNGQFTAVSVAEMLSDMEQLHRSEFLQRSIEFRLNVAPDLPRVRCHAQQLRQAVLHCLQFAIEAVESRNLAGASEEQKTVRLEATSDGNLVQILVAHSGSAFLHPDRAFDPFVPAQASGETAGLGLSLCASIVRDYNGRACALNLEPRGAAILLELQAA